jgi:SH3-like domain-containing protein
VITCRVNDYLERLTRAPLLHDRPAQRIAVARCGASFTQARGIDVPRFISVKSFLKNVANAESRRSSVMTRFARPSAADGDALAAAA